jgi:cytochrome c-type biogenesis protein CcmH/NrfG
MERAIRLDPYKAERYVQLGLAHMQLNDPGSGAQAFEKALGLNPAHNKARVGLGMALMHQNRINAAIVQLEKAIQEEPAAPFTMGLLTQAYLLKGDETAAKEMYHLLKNADPALAAKMFDVLE